jgi:hypothetical protein
MASGSASARRDISESDNQNRGSGYVNPNSFTGMMQPGNMANGEFAMPNISMSSPSLSLNQNSQLPNNGRSNIPQQDGANDELTTEVHWKVNDDLAFMCRANQHISLQTGH